MTTPTSNSPKEGGRVGAHWENCEQSHHECALAKLAAALEENAKLRKHAEAMHEEIEKLRSYLARLHGGETIRSAPADAYRADFPKETDHDK